MEKLTQKLCSCQRVVTTLAEAVGMPFSVIVRDACIQTYNSQPSTDLAISVRYVNKMYPLYPQPSDRLKQLLWYALPRFFRCRFTRSRVPGLAEYLIRVKIRGIISDACRQKCRKR